MTREMNERIAILISGKGSNMMEIVDSCFRRELNARVIFVASDKADAKGLLSAAQSGISTLVLPYPDKKKAEKILSERILDERIAWLVLAGFMRILSSEFVGKHEGRIINIHPSLLPAFPGAHAIRDAWEFGVKVTGVTVHEVDEEVDHGRILAQEAVPVLDDDTLESLEDRIHKSEHKLYPATLNKIISKKTEKE